MNNERTKKTEDILGSLDGIQRASIPAFFYTRLKAKMLAQETIRQKGLDQGSRRSWVLRPAYALAALILVLLINTAVILNSGSSKDNTAAAGDTETIQSIATAYNLNDNNTVLFDINQDK